MIRSRADSGLRLLRLGLAAIFIYNGGQKVFGWFGGSGLTGFAAYLSRIGVSAPAIAAPLVAFSELLGGLSVLFGWGTTYVLSPLAVTMVVACYVNSRAGFDNAHGGSEFPLLCLCTILAIILLGPGQISLAHLQSARQKEVR